MCLQLLSLKATIQKEIKRVFPLFFLFGVVTELVWPRMFQTFHAKKENLFQIIILRRNTMKSHFCALGSTVA